MLKVTLEKGVEFSFPVAWEELTYRQMYDLLTLEESSNYEAVRLILGMDFEKFYSLEKAIYDSLERALFLWVNNPIDYSAADVPAIFMFHGVGYSLPTEIGRQSIAQYKDVQSQISELGAEATHLKIMALFPVIVATYLQPLIDEQYAYSKSQKLVDDVWNCNGVHVLQFGNFFLSSLKTLSLSTTPTLPKRKSTLSNVWRGLRKFLKGLVLRTLLNNSQAKGTIQKESKKS